MVLSRPSGRLAVVVDLENTNSIRGNLREEMFNSERDAPVNGGPYADRRPAKDLQ